MVYENQQLYRDTFTLREEKYIEVLKVKLKYMCCILQVKNANIILYHKVKQEIKNLFLKLGN